MSVTSFANAINNVATTVASAYTAGSGSLTVADASGITLSSGQWVRISTFRNGNPISILKATAVSGNVLTIAGAAPNEGSAYADVNLLVGDAAELRVTAGAFTDIQAAINALESGAGGTGDMLSVLVNSPVSITGTTSLSSSAFGKMHVCSGTSSSYTVTLPSPTSNAGKFIGFRMDHGLTKLVTITHNASENIDGASSRIMWANESAILGNDGTNWYKIAGKTIPMICSMSRHASYSISSGSATVIPVDTTLVDNTGLMADPTTNHHVYIVRGGYYVVSGTTWYNNIGAANRVECRLHRNGTEESVLSIPTVATNSVGPGTTYIASCSVSDYLDIGGLQDTGSSANTYADWVIISAVEQPQW